MKKFFIYIIVLICVTRYTLNVTRVYAQQVSLSISPPLLETVIKPGKSILIAYTIGNAGDPVVLKSTILPFEPKNNQGNVFIKPEFSGPIRFNLDNSDLQLEQSFFLKTGQMQQLLLRIRVPEGTPETDYYYTLLVESEPPPTTEGIASSRAKATIGSNILISVTQLGSMEVQGKIASFQVKPRWQINLFGNKYNLVDSNDSVPVIFIVENTGKNLVKPAGEITLVGNFGEKARYPILSQNILANSQRLMLTDPPQDLNKPYTLMLSGFLIGKYNLSTAIHLGDNAINLYATDSFIALPLKIILAIIIIIAIAIFVLKRQKDDQNNQ